MSKIHPRYDTPKYPVGSVVTAKDPRTLTFAPTLAYATVIEYCGSGRYRVEHGDNPKRVANLHADEIQLLEPGFSFRKECTCSGWDLFRAGCKCGGFILTEEKSTGKEAEDWKKVVDEHKPKPKEEEKKKDDDDDISSYLLYTATLDTTD
jgi:hypothetical protein